MNIFIQDKSTQHRQEPELKLCPDINYSGYCMLMIYLQRMTVLKGGSTIEHLLLLLSTLRL